MEAFFYVSSIGLFPLSWEEPHAVPDFLKLVPVLFGAIVDRIFGS